MEFLKVSENKLKIILSSSEMEKYKLSEAELDYQSPELRESFWGILDKAHAACGFSAKGEKVLVQMYPSKSGGELFITKLGALSKSAEHSIKNSGRVAMLESELKISKFESIGAAVAGVSSAKSSLTNEARAYLAKDGSVYLVFEDRAGKSSYILSEFARQIPNNLEFYIKEHAREISNPVESFSKLALASRE